MKHPKNSLLIICHNKIANKLMTVASVEINSQSIGDRFCHIAKAKAAMSALT